MAVDRVSRELTEVRTVLGRARNALGTISEALPEYRDQSRNAEGNLPGYLNEADPMLDQMTADLEQVVAILAKYSRK